MFTRAPLKYDEIFSFESGIDLSDRAKGLYQLFSEYIQPIVTLASTKSGIFELDKNGQLHLLPAVKEALAKTGSVRTRPKSEPES